MNGLHGIERLGTIEQVLGLVFIANGPPQVFIGELCELLDTNQRVIGTAEVIAFAAGKVHLMPFEQHLIGMGYQVRATGSTLEIKVGSFLLGHTVNAFAQPLDTSPIPLQSDSIATANKKISPLLRQAITQKLTTGVAAIDSLLPFGQGQRIGIFAGSGVGKSTLLGEIAQHIDSDVNVIALIGERGREVCEFIEHYLDEHTLKKTILVVACSDESSLMRKQAAFTATAIAEYFCQQGQHVMLFMDSITRFAMALREIGLSLGEPPTARGYTPSVFALLPGLVERSGNFKNQGSISALYTVLVEGDDFNEPLADHMRSLLDGHIILSRALAHRAHYPAIEITQSISRLSSQLLSPSEQGYVNQMTTLISTYKQHQDLIDLGAYKAGSNLLLDKAVNTMHAINSFLTQRTTPSRSFAELMVQLEELVQ